MSLLYSDILEGFKEIAQMQGNKDAEVLINQKIKDQDNANENFNKSILEVTDMFGLDENSILDRNLTESTWAENIYRLSPARQKKLEAIMDAGLWEDFEDAVLEASDIVVGIFTDQLNIQNNAARTEPPYITDEQINKAKKLFYKLCDEWYEKAKSTKLKEHLSDTIINNTINIIIDRMDSQLKEADDVGAIEFEFELPTIDKKELSKIFELLNRECYNKYINYEIIEEETYSNCKYYLAKVTRSYPDDYYFDYENEETTQATEPGQRTGKYKNRKNESMKFKSNNKTLMEATGYTWTGDPVDVRDYDQDLITTEDIIFYNVSDNYETFDAEEMMESELYDEDNDEATIPEGTTLIFDGMDRNGTHGVAVYSLPEYNDIEIRIYFDYWSDELQYQVKPLEGDWEEADDEEYYRYQYFLNDDPLDEFTDEDEALNDVLEEIRNTYMSDDEYNGELSYIELYRAEGDNDTGDCIESWQNKEVVDFLTDNGFTEEEINKIVDPDYLNESMNLKEAANESQIKKHADELIKGDIIIATEQNNWLEEGEAQVLTTKVSGNEIDIEVKILDTDEVDKWVLDCDSLVKIKGIDNNFNENMNSKKEIYYTLHQTNENGDSYNKENYITKDDVRKALNELIDTYINYGSDDVRGLLVTEGDDEKQIALYWSTDGMGWVKDFDFLNDEIDTNDDFGGTDMLDLDESMMKMEEGAIPSDYNISTLDEIIPGFIDNMEDSQIDREIKFFKSIANRLSVKDYGKLYVVVDDGEYDPEFIFQDGLRLPGKDDKKLIYFEKENMVAEYNNGLIFMYFTTKDDAKLYLETAYRYLNPIEVDEDKEDFAENKIDSDKIDSSIKLKRIDDEFKW